MNKVKLKIASNRKIADKVYEMRLRGDVGETKAGQFVEISVPNLYLRRPLSVCDSSAGALTVVYKVVGKGTEIMSGLAVGEELDVLTGLGNGYDLSASGDRPLLVGGGVGVPPLYKLCKELTAQGKRPTVVLGFNTAREAFYESEFIKLGADTRVTTVDGTLGLKGFVTDAMNGLDYTYFYACGPKAMFAALEKVAVTDGEYSLEERMACGFGACLGCSVPMRGGMKRVCKDGPVFKRSEILW